MNMKIVISLTISAILGFALIVHAQQATRVYRIGYLSAGSGRGPIDEAVRQDLRERGYIDGQNLVSE